MSKKALVIGNDSYHDSPLSGCVNDARCIAHLLKRNSDESPNFSTDLRLDESARLIKHSIKSLFEGQCDVALLYFAGHGTSAADESGIVGIDGNVVSFNYIMSHVAKSKHRHNILIFDSCFSGDAGHCFNNSDDTASVPSGVTILSACRKNEMAAEQSGHGLFTSILMDALDGGAANLLGDITPGAVYAYVDRCLGPWDQRPVFKTHVDSFCSIRKVKAPVPLSVLRKLPELFPSPVYSFPLDPSYEPTNSPLVEHKVIEPYVNDNNAAVFRDLQILARVGLVVPFGAEHMYFAAMESKECKLTPIGIHYWELASQEKI